MQLIMCCKAAITNGNPPSKLLDQDPLAVLLSMESCLKLNEQYQLHYKATKDKLLSTPKGRQFEFAEEQVLARVCCAVPSQSMSTIERCSSLSCRFSASLTGSAVEWLD